MDRAAPESSVNYMVYIVIVLIALVLTMLFFFIKKKQDELERKFQEQYADKNIRRIDKTVYLAAQESRGYSQTQGLGYLILTDDHLYFEMQLTPKNIPIPLSSITNVGQTRRMGGKSTGKLWLKVEYKDDKGNDDALALSVKDLTLWKNEILKTIQK